MTINTDHLERATAGDRALQLELLSLFRNQLCATSEFLMRGDAAANRDELTGALHRLKGAAQAMGAEPLAIALGDAEIAVRDDMPESDPRHAFRTLHFTLEHTTDAVEALLAMRQPAGLAKAGESG